MLSPLKDKWIVVTRATHQSGALVKKLKDAEANVIEFPLLEIHPTKDVENTKKKLTKINQYKLLIFVSVNAVDQCMQLVPTDHLNGLRIAAVGKKTAQRLKHYGLQVCCSPQAPYNSEALLALPELTRLGKRDKSDVDGVDDEADKVAIIRGEGGRELLKSTLQRQGVSVDYIDIYSRNCPQKTLNKLTSFHDQGHLDIIVVTSLGSAISLFELQDNNSKNTWLNDAYLMSGSNRITLQIQTKTPHKGKLYSAQDPSDETLYQELLLWAKRDN